VVQLGSYFLLQLLVFGVAGRLEIAFLVENAKSLSGNRSSSVSAFLFDKFFRKVVNVVVLIVLFRLVLRAFIRIFFVLSRLLPKS